MLGGFMRTTLALFVALTGCSTEYGLSTPAPGDADPSVAAGARDAGEPADGQTHRTTKKVAEKADFLFVVDPSVSMFKVLKNVRAGFASLDSAEFSRDTRIAVMTTTPASVDGTRPHISVVDTEGALRDPGFQKLIRGRDIAKWRGVEATDACGDGWFAPTDTLSDGTPCLQAVTTFPLYASNAEAGLIAFKQMLLRQGDQPLFRQGAEVNVVFISDTHDPGLPEGKARDLMVEFRPDFAELKSLVDANHELASFEIHAIAPTTGCVGVEDFEGIGTSYYDVALASGGRIVDVCETDDYTPILRDLFVRTRTKADAKPAAVTR